MTVRLSIQHFCLARTVSVGSVGSYVWHASIKYASWLKLAEIGSWEAFPQCAKVGTKVTHLVGVVTRAHVAQPRTNRHAGREREQVRNRPRHWREL